MRRGCRQRVDPGQNLPRAAWRRSDTVPGQSRISVSIPNAPVRAAISWWDPAGFHLWALAASWEAAVFAAEGGSPLRLGAVSFPAVDADNRRSRHPSVVSDRLARAGGQPSYSGIRRRRVAAGPSLWRAARPVPRFRLAHAWILDNSLAAQEVYSPRWPAAFLMITNWPLRRCIPLAGRPNF